MKKLLGSLCLAFSLLAPPTFFVIAPTALVLATTEGCKTANRSAYVVTGSVVVTVDAAMKAWGDYVHANHPPLSQEVAVKNAFEKYQAAALVVTSAGAAHARILATQGADQTTTLSALNAALAIASASLADLITLVQQFGVKL